MATPSRQELKKFNTVEKLKRLLILAQIPFKTNAKKDDLVALVFENYERILLKTSEEEEEKKESESESESGEEVSEAESDSDVGSESESDSEENGEDQLELIGRIFTDVSSLRDSLPESLSSLKNHCEVFLLKLQEILE